MQSTQRGDDVFSRLLTFPNVIITGQHIEASILSSVGLKLQAIPDVFSGFVAKLDPDGNGTWSFSFGFDMAGYHQRPHAVAIDSRDDVLIAGQYRGLVAFGDHVLPNFGPADAIFIAKLTETLDEPHCSWARGWGNSTATQYVAEVALDSEDNVVLAAGIRGPVDFGSGELFGVPDYYSVLVAKLDSDGKTIWSQAFGEPDQHQYVTALAIDSADNILVSGYFAGTLALDSGSLQAITLAQYDAFTVKLAPNGKVLCARQAGNGEWDTYSSAIAVGSDDSFIITGRFRDVLDFGFGEQLSGVNDGTGFDMFLARYGR